MSGTIKQELEIFYRMSGVFVQMLMYDAEKQESTIRADVNFMENYKALQDMKEFEQLIMNQDYTLVSKQDVMQAAARKMEKEKEDQQVKQQNHQLVNEVMELKKQLTLKDHEINEKSAAASKTDDQPVKLQRQLTETQNELDKKINQTAAVQNMKKMLQEKNQLIKELREQIAKYEQDQQ